MSKDLLSPVSLQWAEAAAARYAERHPGRGAKVDMMMGMLEAVPAALADWFVTYVLPTVKAAVEGRPIAPWPALDPWVRLALHFKIECIAAIPAAEMSAAKSLDHIVILQFLLDPPLPFFRKLVEGRREFLLVFGGSPAASPDEISRKIRAALIEMLYPEEARKLVGEGMDAELMGDLQRLVLEKTQEMISTPPPRSPGRPRAAVLRAFLAGTRSFFLQEGLGEPVAKDLADLAIASFVESVGWRTAEHRWAERLRNFEQETRPAT